MFRKYEKTFRIDVPQFKLNHKLSLPEDKTKLLLGGKVTITEKLDGANIGIIRHKDKFALQKRGSLVGSSEHLQFNFFKNWASNHYNEIMELPNNTILYGELLFCKHHIYYEKLPDYVCFFALYSKFKNEYLPWDFLKDICDSLKFSTVPLIAKDAYVNRKDLFSLIPGVSAYGSNKAEGIVVWNFKHQLRGKLVRPEFVKEIDEDEHWTKDQITINKVSIPK